MARSIDEVHAEATKRGVSIMVVLAERAELDVEEHGRALQALLAAEPPDYAAICNRADKLAHAAGAAIALREEG